MWLTASAVVTTKKQIRCFVLGMGDGRGLGVGIVQTTAVSREKIFVDNLNFQESPICRSTWQKAQTKSSYDKVPKAINFRALAQKNQLKILESKDAISRRKDINMVTFDSRFLS